MRNLLNRLAFLQLDLKDVGIFWMIALDVGALKTADQRSDRWSADAAEPIEDRYLMLTRGGNKGDDAMGGGRQ